MKVVISSGHGKYVRGASGYLDEVNEARKVVETVAEFFRSVGVEAMTFHDDTSTSQNQNLSTIVNYHNRQTRDYDISVHFNAYQTTSKGMGTETLYVSNTGQTLATKLSPAIARAGTFIDRGPKYRSDLYFLNNTAKPAILIETCFVDSSTDANLYRQNYEAICQAIAETISGQSVPTEPPEPIEPPVEPPPEVTGDNQVNITGDVAGDVTIYINGSMVIGHEGCEHVAHIEISKKGDVVVTVNGEEFHDWPATTEPPGGGEENEIPSNQTNIICTVFKDSSTAYPPYDGMTNTELSVALPFKFQGPRQEVRVINRTNGKEVVCKIRDVGPWLTDDPYWNTTERPLAETCYKQQKPLPRGPHKGKIPNGAGIDVSPGAEKALGFSGKANVDWDFVAPAVA